MKCIPKKQQAKVQPMLQQLPAGWLLRMCRLLLQRQQLQLTAEAMVRVLTEQRTMPRQVTKGLRCGLLSCS